MSMKLMTTAYLLLFMIKCVIFNGQDVFWKTKNSEWISVNCAAHCLRLCVIEGFSISAIAQALAATKH